MTEATPPEASHNPCLREVSVEIPANVVVQESQSIVQKYQKQARLPGFRKGKAPASVIRQRFAEELRSDLVEQLVPRYFREQVEKQGLAPVSQPQVTDLHLHEGEPLRFKASFEVLPEFDVKEYQELRAETLEVKVTDEEVESELKNLREQRATYTAIEGSALADGDYAEIGFTGMPGEAGGKPITVDEVLVEIGGANTVREFSENLRGARAGEERTFPVPYAEDFNDPRLAGKTFDYRVTIKTIKQKNLPVLDEDFAKALGEFDSLTALRQRIYETMEQERKHRAEHEAKEKLLAELVKRNPFPVPEALVEHQVDLRLERGLRALAAQGLRAEDMQKMDIPRLRAGQRETAVQEVKASLLLEKIADAEKIEISDQDIDKEIESLAAQTRQSADDIRARLTREGALDRIRGRIRNEKALDFLYRRSA